MPRILMIGLVAGAVIALAIFMIGSGRAPSSTGGGDSSQSTPTDATLEEVLFGAYYKPFTLSSELMRGVSASTRWSSAAKKYRNRDYRGALPDFKSSLANQEMPTQLVQFYLGQTHLALGDAASAGVAFAAALKGDGSLSVEARWYAALVLLKLQQTTTARQHLEKLEKTYRAVHAQEVLEQLSKGT